MHEILHHVRKKIFTYSAGNTSIHYQVWQSMTLDKYILDILKNGLPLTLNNIKLLRKIFKYPETCSDSKIFDTEIENLLQKTFVMKTDTKTGEYFSNLCTRKNKDGTFRTIVNLKSMNDASQSTLK